MRLTEFTEAAQIKTDDNFRTYRALQSIEKNMNAQGLKGPQALEFLQTSLLDTALNIVGREKRAGYEPHVVNVKNWADAKEFLMTAFRDAREQGVTESDEDRSHFIRHNIWTVMDGDEEVMQHPVEGDPFFSAKKFIRDLDDEGYEFTHVVSPEGEVTYLPHLDPRNFPKDVNVDDIASEGYRVVPGYDKEKYQEREGLEGPFHTKSGKVVYYDKKEGSYYDPDTDMYISYEDWQAMNEEGVAEGSDLESKKIGRIIKKYYQQIADQGDDSLDYLHDRAEQFARIWDIYEGDLDSIIADEPVELLKMIAIELKEIASELLDETYKQGHAKFHTKTNKQIGPTHYGKGSDKKADSYTKADPRYHEVRPFKEQGMAEAGFGRATGRAAWDSNMPGYQGDYGGAENWGRRHREDDEHHEIDRRQEQQAASGTWYITIDGKLLKNKEGQPFTFVGKAAATKAAQTMMAKPFNQGKKFMLTTKGE